MLMLPNSIYCHNGIATLLVPHPVYCHTIGATWMSMLRNSICCHTIVATLLLPNSIYCHNGVGRLLLPISIYCHTVRIGPTVVFRCQNYRNVFNFYFFFQLMIYVFRPSTKKTLVLLRQSQKFKYFLFVLFVEIMDKNLENHNLNEYDDVAKASMSGSKTKERSSKCSQCDFASNHTGSLRRHLKIHSGEKSNQCNQCDFASSWADSLRTHMKKHV